MLEFKFQKSGIPLQQYKTYPIVLTVNTDPAQFSAEYAQASLKKKELTDVA